jgi:hypothetical protein
MVYFTNPLSSFNKIVKQLNEPSYLKLGITREINKMSLSFLNKPNTPQPLTNDQIDNWKNTPLSYDGIGTLQRWFLGHLIHITSVGDGGIQWTKPFPIPVDNLKKVSRRDGLSSTINTEVF